MSILPGVIMALLSSIGSGLYDLATINPFTLGYGAYLRSQRLPTSAEFFTGTQANLTPQELRAQQFGQQQQGLSRVQNSALQDMQNQGFFGSLLQGAQSLRDESLNNIFSKPGELAGSALRSTAGYFGVPMGENLQKMNNEQQGYDPNISRYNTIENLANSLESSNLPGIYGNLGRIGGSAFGPTGEALGGMYGGRIGGGLSSLLNPGGMFGQSQPYRQNFQRQYGMTQQTPRYWDMQNRNINPMQRGY